MARDPARQLRVCYPPDPNPKTPAFKTPAGSCDTHFHVFGPPEKFPYSDKRVYTPPAAPFEHYMAMADIVGIQRGVVVTPMAHGTDNRATLDAVARSGGWLLGMAKIDDSFTEKDLRELHEKGIRGVRFNLIEESGGAVDLPLFERIAARIHQFGWCMCFHVMPDEMVEHFDWFGTLPTPVVIDHICRLPYERGTSQAPFRKLLELMRNDKMWLKISGADRQKSRGFPMTDVIPYTIALAEVAPDRLIWGTDWPHGNIFKPNSIPNDGDLIDILPKLVPDAGILKKILVDNPAQLFGFDRTDR
jgi:predicted TIM-barrel fold metal-dependent hydrolase